MSYPAFGYTYSAPSSSALDSQLLAPGAPAAASLPALNSSSNSSSASACGGSSTEPSRSVSSDNLTPSPAPPPPPPLNPSAQPQTLPAAPLAPPAVSMYNASSLLTYGPAAARMLSDSVYSSAYAAQGYMPFGADPSAFYSPLGGDNTDAWRSLSTGTTGWPYDPNMAGYPYGASYGGLDVRRKNATRESTSTLKAWLYEHIKNPYPTKGEKIMLAIITKMTLTQVSTWFANARRRLKKENKMQWSPRNRAGDDDDDKNSDDDDDDDDHKNGSGDSNNNQSSDSRDAGGKRPDPEDEDVVVDGGNDDSLLSDPAQDIPSKFSSSSLLQKETRCFDLSKDSSLPSPLSSPSALGSSLLSPLHRPHASSPPSSTSCASRLQGLAAAADNASTDSPFSANKLDQSAVSDKPRIWSLADVATSSTPPTSKRASPLLGLNLNSMSSSGPKMPQTAFSAPPGSGLSFQPWMNGSFSSSPGPGTSSTLSMYGYSPLSHPSLGGPSPSQGSMSTQGIMGAPHSPARPNPTLSGSASQLPVVPSLTPHSVYASKISNGYAGDKTDLPQLPSFTSSSDSHTAFKPVPKRL